MRARPDRTLLLFACVLAGGCLRAPIGDDDYGDGSNGFGSGSSSSGQPDDGASSRGSSDTTALDESSGETTSAPEPAPEPEPACHPSYEPCLPIVGDLDCDDVIGLGAAPVFVVGPDDYGLDSDHDGIGCEQ